MNICPDARARHGFTLLEIVMVLMLLGILSAVALPKYFEYQATAEERAALATVAEVQSRLEATFGEKLLEGLSCEEALSYASNIKNLSGDGSLAFGVYTLSGGSGESVTVSRGNSVVLSNAPLTYPVCGGAVTGNSLFNRNFANYIRQSMIAGYNAYRGKPDSTGIEAPTWQLNSNFGGTAIDGSNNYFEGKTSLNLAEIGAATWAYNPHSDYQQTGDGYFFWTDKALTTGDIGKEVPVVVYDTKTGGYSVAIAQVSRDVSSSTRAILLLGELNKPLTSYTTYNNTGYNLSAAEAQKLYNEAKNASSW